MQEHAVCKVWLKKIGNKILINGKDFFSEGVEELEGKFNLKPIIPYISVGEDLFEESQDPEEQEVTELSYEELKCKYDHSVYRVPAYKNHKWVGWHRNQKVIYVVAERNLYLPDELNPTTFRTNNLKILFNRKRKWVQGIGVNFGTPWGRYGPGDITPKYAVEEKVREYKNLNTAKIVTDPEQVMRNHFESSMGIKKEEVIKKIKINGIPMIFTDDKRILAMPKYEEFVPILFMVGARGGGKTLFMNYFLSMVHRYWNDRVGIMCDPAHTFFDWMLPMTHEPFNKEMARIGITPRHQAVITLYTSCPHVNIKYRDENVGYRLVIDFKDFIKKFNYYISNEYMDLSLGKSQKRLIEHIDELKFAKDIDEFNLALEKMFPNLHNEKKGDAERNMYGALSSAFRTVFESNVTSNLFQNEPSTASEWTLVTKDGKKITGNPFFIAAYAGLMPVIDNSMAMSTNKEITKRYLTELLDDVITWQTLRREDGTLERFIIGFDELGDWLVEKGDDIYKAIDRFCRECRNPRLGLLGNTQQYSHLSDSMRQNTMHIMIFACHSDKERNLIKKDFHLTKEQAESLGKLKPFECFVAVKPGCKMLVYDYDGKVNEYNDGGLWKGTIMKPFAQHMKPSDKNKGVV